MGGFIVRSTNENLLLWEQRIKERVQSGMKVEEWCVKNNVTKHQYYYWYNQIHKKQKISGEEIAFAEITQTFLDSKNIKEVSVPSCDFQVFFKGIQITVPSDFNADALAGLMKVLQAL